jgi:hypothetical protein
MSRSSKQASYRVAPQSHPIPGATVDLIGIAPEWTYYKVVIVSGFIYAPDLRLLEYVVEVYSYGYLSASRATKSSHRRAFLRSATVSGAGSRLFGFSPLQAALLPKGQKTVVVTFGGGARDEETSAPEGQEYSSPDEGADPSGDVFHSGCESWNSGPLCRHSKSGDRGIRTFRQLRRRSARKSYSL